MCWGTIDPRGDILNDRRRVNMPMEVILVSVVALIVLVLLMMLLSRYNKCPSDKVMVI